MSWFWSIVLVLCLSVSWIPIYLLFRYIIVPIIDWFMDINIDIEKKKDRWK